MTTPSERTRALIHAYEVLKLLQDPKSTPRVPSWLREHARSVLRHYPDCSSIQLAHRALPHLFGPVPGRSADVRDAASDTAREP